MAALIFDKDGTLFDYQLTWGPWAKAYLTDLAEGDVQLLERIAALMHFDLAAARFHPSSPFIAEATDKIAGALAPILGRDAGGLLTELDARAARADAVPVAGQRDALTALKDVGFRLAVMTNDSEAAAHAQLAGAGIADLFEHVVGYDTGHGAKPDAAPLLAIADLMGVRPESCHMIGDSLHDLHAGKAAGMGAIGVLTGPATRAELSGKADLVVPSIADLPAELA